MSGEHPVGVVLTGGASTRMGVDKATLLVDGKPMAVRVADALWEAGCRPVECQGGDVAAMEEYGLEVVADLDPDRGPLGAIHEALLRHPGVPVVTAACDLVDLDGDAIVRLIAAGAASDDVDVAVAASGGSRHLVCWWRVGTATDLGLLLTSGVTSFRDALTQLRSVDVDVAPATMRNMNTPSDLHHRG